MWIAFKICIFDFQKQQNRPRFLHRLCCELLSKFVSLTFRNSRLPLVLSCSSVVNCFQNLYLWLSETAPFISLMKRHMLWIAFKICIFDFQKQHSPKPTLSFISCELLSKFVSLTFRNSFSFDTIKEFELWIAFKICIFDFQKQQCDNVIFNLYCCELLSKFVSLTFRNSRL